MPFNEFHYTPTGTGVISGKEVLEQTEDAINDLGGQISGDVQTAIDTANNALNVANTASSDAQNAVNTANTAYTAATNAQNTANAAQNTASNALTAAQNAQNDVNALGNRVTTAENNITQNTTDISGLTTRMGTAEGNITNLQNDVVTAQGTATSAQNTATMARQQAYVLRYSSTAITDNSTIAYSTLDNTDNIKASDKIIDSDGKIFSIVSVDTANQTVTVGSALIDLALDANVVHTSGNETATGFKTFENIRLTNSIRAIALDGETIDINNCYSSFAPPNSPRNGNVALYSCNTDTATANITNLPEQKAFYLISITIRYLSDSPTVKQILITRENVRYERFCSAGTWGNWVKDTDKFVTTEGNQTVSGQKIFTDDLYVYNSDTSGTTPKLSVKTALFEKGDTANTDSLYLQFLDKFSNYVAGVTAIKNQAGSQYLQFSIRTTDADNNNISSTINYYLAKSGERAFTPYEDNLINLGTTQRKWKNTCTNLVNGVAPSGLSMPVDPSSTSYVDISGYITVLDGSAPNTYTPPSNGYITFSVTGNLVQIFHDYGLQGKWSVQAGNANRGFIPVLSGVEIKIYVAASVIDKFWFIPCQGNV